MRSSRAIMLSLVEQLLCMVQPIRPLMYISTTVHLEDWRMMMPIMHHTKQKKHMVEPSFLKITHM